MYDKAPYFYGTGRRKSSVARVRIYQGTGKVTINDRDIDDYFGLDTLKTDRPSAARSHRYRRASSTSFATVAGGGVTGQAGAIRHGISRALLPVRLREPPRYAEEGRFPDPRPENEGKKEVRSQSSSSRSAVQQAIIDCSGYIKMVQKARKIKVFRAFAISKRADMV